MLNSGTAHAHRTFVADVCSDRLNGQHAPPRFLRRNLRVILDAHETLVQQQLSSGRNRISARTTAATSSLSSAAAASDAARRHRAMVANDRLPSGWDYPTVAMCEDLLVNKRPWLKLDRLQFRHRNSEFTLNTPPSSSPDDERDGNPDWLPAPFEVRARISLQVQVSSTQKTIIQDFRLATITRRQDDAKEFYYDVVLDDAFSIELFKIFVVKEEGTNGARHWKKTVTESYALEVTVRCEHRDDGVDLLAQLTGRDVQSFHEASPKEIMLRTSWDGLPQCPARGHMWPMWRVRGNGTETLPYKAEVSMGWNARKDSMLESYNRRYWHPTPPLLPTPSSSDDLEPSSSSSPPKKKTHVVVYKFSNGLDTRIHTVEELTCPLCENREQHPSFDRLHLHLVTNHDHFKIELEGSDGEDDSASSRRTIHRTVFIALADPQPERLLNPRETSEWQAPAAPFNIASELRGDRSTYLSASRPNRTERRRGGGPGGWGGRRGGNNNPDNQDSTTSSAQTSGAPQLRKRPLPAEVPDLPARIVRTNPVPLIPRVRFFDARSKRQHIPGELVANDDEASDKLWQRQARDFTLAKHGIRGHAREFHHAWDDHFAREQSFSCVLFSEGVVRFVRRFFLGNNGEDGNRKEGEGEQAERSLASRVIGEGLGEWKREFWKKMRLFRDKGAVSAEAFEFCVERVGGVDEGNRIANGRHAPRSGNGHDQNDEASSVSAHDNTDAEDRRPRKRQRFAADVRNGKSPATTAAAAAAGGISRPRWDPTTLRFYTLDSDANGSPVEINDSSRSKAALVNGSGSGGSSDLSNGTGADVHGNGIACKPRRDPNCRCGRPARGNSGTIMCANPNCPTSAFHMACVGLENRPPEWTCRQCSG